MSAEEEKHNESTDQYLHYQNESPPRDPEAQLDLVPARVDEDEEEEEGKADKTPKQKFNLADVREQKILEKLHRANDYIEINDLESALSEFSKILFFDKNIPEVYAERAEIYIKLCDFSSAIANFKKALQGKIHEEWEKKLNQLYFLKGLTLIEEGYCNDALNLVKTLESDDVKFIYLKALAYIRAGNKYLAFEEIERCLEKDPTNVEVLILKGKLLWSIDKVEDGNEQFWMAHSLNPEHHEVVEFLSIMKPKAEEMYQKAIKYIFEQNHALAFDCIRKGLELFRDMSKLLLLRASLHRDQKDFESALNDLERASKFMYQEGLENEVKIQIGLTYNCMGSSLYAKGKYHDAVTIFNEALNFMPADPGVYINRGDAYRELKKFNLTLSDYHYALDLGGEEDVIKSRLSLTHYALGVACFNQQDYEGANIEFSRAIDYSNTIADVYVNRARSCMELGLLESAYKDLQRALQLEPRHQVANSIMTNFNKEKKPLFFKGKFYKP